MFLFALGVFIMNNSSFTTFLIESPMSVKIVPAILVSLCAFLGLFGMVIFISITIVLLGIEHHNKKANEYNCKLIKKLKVRFLKGVNLV